MPLNVILFPHHILGVKKTIPSEEELSGKSQHTVYEINYEQVYKGIIVVVTLV